VTQKPIAQRSGKSRWVVFASPSAWLSDAVPFTCCHVDDDKHALHSSISSFLMVPILILSTTHAIS
jgi:hypothetical protein